MLMIPQLYFKYMLLLIIVMLLLYYYYLILLYYNLITLNIISKAILPDVLLVQIVVPNQADIIREIVIHQQIRQFYFTDSL